MNESVRRKITEAAKWLSDHKTDPTVDSDKVNLCENLLRTNKTLVSTLHKLKLLYEKKNAQYEATKAVVNLERELYDADLLNTITAASGSLVASAVVDEDENMATVRKMAARTNKISSAREQRVFYTKTLSTSVELLAPVKKFATDGIVTEDVMQSCFEIFTQENPNVLFVSPAIVQSILASQNSTVVFDHLTQLNALKYEACFFPLLDERGNAYHWSLILYAKNVGEHGSLYLYDSRAGGVGDLEHKLSSLISLFFNTQTFHEVRLGSPKEKHESGYQVIENVTKLLPMLGNGVITVEGVEVTLENIHILKVFTLKCRILVMKLYLQRKLQLVQERADQFAE